MTPLRLLLASAAAALASAACSGPERSATAEPPPPPVGEIRLGATSPQLAHIGVDTVKLRTEKVTAILPAQLVLDEARTARVASQVAGRVRSVQVQVGDRVFPGQPLAHIAASEVGQAESDLLKAEAVARQSAAALERARDLYAHQVVALKDLQQAESDAAQAQAERERAAARVRLLGTARDAVTLEQVLRAPIGGEVIERNASVGAGVEPDASQPLFTISSLDTLWLTATAYQRDVAAARPGDKIVFVTDAVSGQRFEATVQTVSPSLDPQDRTASVRASLPNPGGLLRPQMFGEARLVAVDAARVPVVPVEALVTRGQQMVVYLQSKPGWFVRRPVTIGADDGEIAEITSGLRAGEVVVTRGSLLLDAEAPPDQ